MKDLLSKLSSYDIFNYLLTGVVFATLTKASTNFELVVSDPVAAGFMYYFMGLVVSRLGSLVIEPALKAAGFVKFTSYTDFIIASKKDPKVEELSAVNNTYRTLISVALAVLLVKGYEKLEAWCVSLANWRILLLSAGLFLLFLVSYRKQTAYVRERVQLHTKAISKTTD